MRTLRMPIPWHIAALFAVLLGVVGTAAVTLTNDAHKTPATKVLGITIHKPATSTSNSNASSNGNGPTGTFGLSGSLSNVVPGAPATNFPVTVTNPNPWPIQVLTVSPAVSASASKTCATRWLTVTGYAYSTGNQPFTVAARSSNVLNLSATFQDSRSDDQTSCMNAAYTVNFTGTAQKVPGR